MNTDFAMSDYDDRIRILVYGHINLNVMDGSAVFLSGFATMLSQNPNIQIDLILANPVKRDILIKPLLNIPNINILSPFDDSELIKSSLSWALKGQMNYHEASQVIQYYWNKKDYDWFFIRGTEVAEELIGHEIIHDTMVYVTGITHEGQELPSDRRKRLNLLFQSCAYLVCQTKEMGSYIGELFNEIDSEKIITLNPMIPDTVNDFEQVFEKKDKYNRLCYTGKFAEGWNSIPIVMAFKELKERYPELTLEVAGDKFNIPKDNPNYKKELEYLLRNTENLIWHGAVSRSGARKIIINSDIGITWRDPSMDSSLELSTKLLEYGSLGKAVILNPTPMHLKLFGEDYPLYAVSPEDFIKAVETAINNPDVYEFAAERMFNVSQLFTYSETLKKLMPYLVKNKVHSFFENNGFEMPKEVKQFFKENKQTDDFKVEIKNKNNNKYICIINTVQTFHSVMDLISDISKLGELQYIYNLGSHVILLIKENDYNFKENFWVNVNKKSVLQLLQFSSYQSFVNKMNDGTIDKLYNKQELLIKHEPDEILQLKEENRILKKKYNALNESKFGKLAKAYWNIRRKFKV